MFIDKAKIFITAGRGGDGCISFRREKYVPLGGPDGGNGGKGGDVFIETDNKKITLLDLSYRPKFHAENGFKGENSNKYGKYGKDLVIKVPLGTIIYKNNELFADLKEIGQSVLVAKGGRGGRGNSSFKTQNHTVPRIAEKGEPGETSEIDLELRLIADVGLVGFPNAGKSTFLSIVSSARPKIADYPFTTLEPNLGVVSLNDRQIVIADIPGIIEGASHGKGLGFEFLRHIKRTKVLIYMIDASGFDGKDPYEVYKVLKKELKQYSKFLSNKHMVIALNKIDIDTSLDNVKLFKKKVKSKNIYTISNMTKEGIDKLIFDVIKLLDLPIDEEEIASIPVKKYIYEPDFVINIDEDGGFIVSGKKVEILVEMTRFNEEEALRRFQNILKKMGVDVALEKKGCKVGDTVRIGKFKFDFAK
ncbi:MAG: GTPase ObgE [Endomicrobiaceae bacterium]|nr:GTPase ObgE [Endomicrobiaceae bacterium]MDD3054192.1 GTPase ObgE [Endomicrobiaceae bacterium]